MTAKEPLFWVQNEPVYTFWRQGEEDPHLVRHLAEPVRILVGFWRHQEVPIIERSEAAGLFPGEYIALNRMLYTSQEGIIKVLRKFGLPASASVKLNKSFRCAKCFRYIDHLPCVQCWEGHDDDPHSD